jgi:hypothetical protein
MDKRVYIIVKREADYSQEYCAKYAEDGCRTLLEFPPFKAADRWNTYCNNRLQHRQQIV